MTMVGDHMCNKNRVEGTASVDSATRYAEAGAFFRHESALRRTTVAFVFVASGASLGLMGDDPFHPSALKTTLALVNVLLVVAVLLQVIYIGAYQRNMAAYLREQEGPDGGPYTATKAVADRYSRRRIATGQVATAVCVLLMLGWLLILAAHGVLPAPPPEAENAVTVGIPPVSSDPSVARTSQMSIVVVACTVVGTLAVVLTAIVIWRQLRATNRALRGSAWLKAQEIVMKDDFRRAREVVFKFERPLQQDDWANDETRQHALLVCRRMDELCHLAQRDIIPLDTLLKVWGDILRKAWIVLRPLVNHEREKRDWEWLWMGFACVGGMAIDKFGYPVHWRAGSEDHSSAHDSA